MSAAVWENLDALKSRGSIADRPGSLGGLHKIRFQTLSQFFTPAWVVDRIWHLIAPAFQPQERYVLLDNSIGAASLFRGANPLQHIIEGFDTDGELVEKVATILEESGFTLDIQHLSLETARLGQYSAALINPPFSITLSSPLLKAYKGVTHYGSHGPDSSAASHEYALMQALSHASLVTAILPATTIDRLIKGQFGKSALSRLLARYSLPRDTFSAESVSDVACELVIFSEPTGAGVPEAKPLTRTEWPAPLQGIACPTVSQCARRSLRGVGLDDSEPATTCAITGDRRVELTRSGRWVKLGFSDAATEIRTLNALYQQRLASDRFHRYPTQTRYSGQWKLNLDVIMLQPCPFEALDQIKNVIRGAGGEPVVKPQLLNDIRQMVKIHERMTVPYGRWAYRQGTPEFQATARRLGMIDQRKPRSAVSAGDNVCAVRTEVGFCVETQRGRFDCAHDQFFSLFEGAPEAMGQGYWEEVTPPIKTSYPQAICDLERRALALGLDKWLTWDFQLEDLCELAFRPTGGVCGWQMALGKTRLVLALGRLLSGPSLIVVRSRLVDELRREIKTLGLPAEEYAIIDKPSNVANLRKINIISYERLKRPLDERFPKHTLERLLRGKIDNVLCDEGGLLSSEHSQQTRALWKVGGRRHFAFDGTPMANYPREMLPLAAWAIGEERSYQPYSRRGAYIHARYFHSALNQPTGRQQFLDDFVAFDWATNEFLDSGKGAKREIPRIKSEGLQQFRQWLGPMVKRRLQQEPAVARHVRFPVPTLNKPEIIEWDHEHLELYVRSAEDFADWYRNYYAEQAENNRGLNLTIILARLEACFKAANAPGTVSGFARPYHGLTSKMRHCLATVQRDVATGSRPIVFARNPSVLRLMSHKLDQMGISNLVFTGQDTIAVRTKKLNSEVREGDVQVMLASLGVTQDGLNLPEFDRFIFYNRSWKSREEFQAIYRLIRPAQKREVSGDFFHLEGSIDEYMGQLVDWKTLASEAGLDYGEAMPDDSEFVHFDAVLMRFIDSIPGLRDTLRSAPNKAMGAAA